MADLGTAYVLIKPSFKGGFASISKQLAGIDGATPGRKVGLAFTNGMGQAVSSGAAKMGAIAGGVSAIVSGAMSAIGGSVSSAISRVDTMSNYPKVMANLGASSDEATASINEMSEHLRGLPTSLDSAASSAQSVYAACSSMGVSLSDATSATMGLNDMLLAGGQGTQVAEAAMTQFTQALAKGVPDMQDWRSLTTAAPAQMNQLAEAMLGAGSNSTDLYDSLQAGTVSMQDMLTAIAQLDTEGGEGFASFSAQAKDATGGIGTAMENVQSAINRAIAKVIEAFGSGSIAAAINGFSATIDTVGTTVAAFVSAVSTNIDTEGFTTAINAIGTAFSTAFGGEGGDMAVNAGMALANVINCLVPVLQAAQPVFQALGMAVQFVCQHMDVLLPVAIGLAGALGALRIVTSISGLFASAAPSIATAGNAGGAAATKLLSLGGAVLMIGGGIFLAANGMQALANAAVTLSSGGTGAAVAMAAMVGVIAGLAVGAAALGPALTAGAVGMVAFGVAVLAVGAGVALAATGMATLAQSLPLIAAYGMTAGVGLAMIGTTSLLATPGMAAFAVAAAAAVIPLAGFALSAGGAADSLRTMGEGAMNGANGLNQLLAGLPSLPDLAKGAGDAMQGLVDKMNACSPSMQSAAEAMSSALASMATAVSGITAAAVGLATLAATSAACQASMKGIGSAAKSASLAVRSMAAAPKTAQTAFASLATTAKANMAKVRSAVQTDMKAVSKAVSTKLKMSRIDVGKLPHFSFAGEFNAKTKSVPRLNVSWYAKGGVFDSPSVIGIGEGGREAALPLNDSVYREIARGIRSQGGGNSVVVNLNYSADADANQMVRDIAAGLRRLQMTGA